MPAGASDDLGRAMPIDQRLGNDKAWAKRAHSRLGWDAHAIISPFSNSYDVTTFEDPSAMRIVKLGDEPLAGHCDVRRNCVQSILATLTRDSNMFSKAGWRQ
jgi:hypothetical protein